MHALRFFPVGSGGYFCLPGEGDLCWYFQVVWSFSSFIYGHFAAVWPNSYILINLNKILIECSSVQEDPPPPSPFLDPSKPPITSEEITVDSDDCRGQPTSEPRVPDQSMGAGPGAMKVIDKLTFDLSHTFSKEIYNGNVRLRTKVSLSKFYGTRARSGQLPSDIKYGLII